MGDGSKEPYFMIEGRGLVRFISLIVAIFAAMPIVRKVSILINDGFRHVFEEGWSEVFMVVGMFILMLVAGSVALKGKFSIP
mgnify:CR=1 FL=1